MDGSDFTQLLELYGVTVIWIEAFPCACILNTGQADRACPICLGKGRYYGDPSTPFEVSITNQTARERAAMAQTMGPGEMGDGVLHIFEEAPCYSQIKSGDQIWDTSREEDRMVVILPGTRYRLPPLYKDLTAMIKEGDGLVRVAAPIPDANRVVSVNIGTRLHFLCPRGYEVVMDMPRIRTFGAGLPKVFGIRLVDMSVR
jgi:hypothetical protein